MQTLTIDSLDGTAEPIDISFDGRGGRMIGLGFINGVLKVLTLGLYSFWAKTEVRRRIWSATRFNGEPLSYTGTGKELLLGFLIVFGAVLVPVMLTGVAAMMLFGKQAASIYQAVLYLLFFLVVGNAMYRAQRYRLSRTEWRGIRGSLIGSPGHYGWTYFWTLAGPFAAIAALAGAVAYVTAPAVGGAIMVLGLVAVFWVLPWRSNRLQGMMTNDMRFGDRPLTYTGSARPLYKRYVVAWLGSCLILAAALASTGAYLMQDDRYVQWFVIKETKPELADIAILGVIWLTALIASAVVTSWYRAMQMNHFAAHTHFEGATFRGEAKGRSLMWLVLSNWLLAILGLIAAFAIGVALMYASGLTPKPNTGIASASPASIANLAPALFLFPSIIIMNTLTTTFAQFRSARYFLSRLKLDGPIHLGAILQSQHTGPKRGEGLAQAFDLDAF